MNTTDAVPLDSADRALLGLSIVLVSLCGIGYELAIASTSSYLLGNSVLQFSLTIGLFMFGMGIGSFLSRYTTHDVIARFVWVETALVVVGGTSTLALFVAFSTIGGLYAPLMYGYLLAIGTLVGIEIPLLLQILGGGDELRKNVANVLSLDYLGALAGSIAFPLLLLPHLGLIRSAFAIGVVNGLVGLLAAHRFRTRLAHPGRVLVAAWAALLLLVGVTIAGTRLTAFAEQHLYNDLIVYTAQSDYQRIVFTRNEMNGDYRLYLDGHLQFAERDEHRYHEALVHPALSLPGPHARVLVLGGGDGLAARELLTYPDVQRVDLVDLDPAITHLASEFPPLRAINRNALDDPRMHVHNADAFTFVAGSREQFDRIVVDMPDPHNEALNKLYSVEFYRLLERRLAPGGVLVTQATSPFLTRCTFWSIEASMTAAGLRTMSYQVPIPTFGIWGFHIAARTPMTPAAMQLRVPTRYLTPGVLAGLTQFDGDTAPRDCAARNSFHQPSLYLTYARESRA